MRDANTTGYNCKLYETYKRNNYGQIKTVVIVIVVAVVIIIVSVVVVVAVVAVVVVA